jgi:TFIIF-interacting CTD phosphatase-like protein
MIPFSENLIVKLARRALCPALVANLNQPIIHCTVRCAPVMPSTKATKQSHFLSLYAVFNGPVLLL